MLITEDKSEKKSFIRQVFEFVGISGIGWLIDFSIYTLLVFLHVQVGKANFISAIPAITFVFFVATKKTFLQNKNGISLRAKYMLYVVYQFVLLSCVSLLNQTLFNALLTLFAEGTLLYRFCGIITKIAITPITMFCNFFVLKHISERM